jgi:hypothetical protein
MVTCVAVCGDSFGCGTGLPDLTCFEQSFAGIVASQLNLPQKVYARSGCCNFTIYLQVKKIIEQLRNNKDIPFILITTTYHERIICPIDDTNQSEPDLSNVEYLTYPPYNEHTHNRRSLPFSLKETKYFSNTFSNIWHYFYKKANGISNFFEKISTEKLKALVDYYALVFDSGIKREYDEALFISMHYKLKAHNIPHLIMGNFITPELKNNHSFMEFNWGNYTQQYPDQYKSGHCNELGNELVGKKVIEHIKKYNLL